MLLKLELLEVYWITRQEWWGCRVYPLRWWGKNRVSMRMSRRFTPTRLLLPLYVHWRVFVYCYCGRRRPSTIKKNWGFWMDCQKPGFVHLSIHHHWRLRRKSLFQFLEIAWRASTSSLWVTCLMVFLVNKWRCIYDMVAIGREIQICRRRTAGEIGK